MPSLEVSIVCFLQVLKYIDFECDKLEAGRYSKSEDALISYLDYLKVDYTGLCFIGCDATPTNTGYKVIKPVPKTG